MDNACRILILEDNPCDAELIQFELQEAGLVFSSKVVMTGKDFIRELQEFSPDIILSDYFLPKYTGAMALAEAKRRCPDAPFILVTGAVSEDGAIEILTSGAKDYVMKSRLNRLAPALRRALAEAEEHRARKTAEEDLRKAHRDLEATVRKRTEALEVEIAERKRTEEALKEYSVQLEAANKELESFSYSISHDLRAPLRAIDGYSRMILKRQGDKFDAETKRHLNQIRDSVMAMGRLIDDLLAFSRVVRMEITTTEIDIGGLMREAWADLQIINPDRNILFKMEDMPVCHGDQLLMKQVCINLLSNAIKFTKLRKVADIEVGGYVKGNEIEYYVKDNGIGFDMAYYNKLFGVFQRLHSHDDFEGTGIGLAIVQRIIHRHGGRVWAEGEIDQGACFYFTLIRKD